MSWQITQCPDTYQAVSYWAPQSINCSHVGYTPHLALLVGNHADSFGFRIVEVFRLFWTYKTLIQASIKSNRYPKIITFQPVLIFLYPMPITARLQRLLMFSKTHGYKNDEWVFFSSATTMVKLWLGLGTKTTFVSFRSETMIDNHWVTAFKQKSLLKTGDVLFERRWHVPV